MLNTLKLLNNKWFITSQEIIKIKQGKSIYFLKCRIIFIDDSELYIEENMKDGNLEYSYHWQSKSKFLIKRWDNAPHYKDVITFPHHIHDPEIKPSFLTNFSDILKEIELFFKNKDKEL